MLKIGKIIGLPLKIFANNQIYIPKEYLSYYGISSVYDKILIRTSLNCLFLSKATATDTKLFPISNGLTRLPSIWVKKHHLQKGDFLYLLGTSSGLLIYTK